MVQNHENLLECLKDKKIYFISDSDLDGTSAHIIGHYYIKPIVSNWNYHITGDRQFAYLNWDYVKQNDIIIFVDTSPDKILYDKLVLIKKEVIIIDHHQSSYNLYNNVIDNFYWKIDECGAELLYNILTKEKRTKRVINQYIQLCSTYDLWKQDSLLWKDAKKLNSILYESVNWSDKNIQEDYKYDLFIDTQIYKFENFKSYSFTFDDLQKVTNAERKERLALEQARKTLQVRIDGKGNKYLFFACNSKISLVASTLLKEYESSGVIYCICQSLYAYNKEHKKSISIRSLDAQLFDCECVASLYKGGGHKCSSGIDFTSRDDNFYDKLILGKVHLI